MKKSKKTILMLVSLAVLLFALVGTTLAYLTTSTKPVVNTFTPTSVPIEIDENLKDSVKEYVKVKNTGNIDAYVRVAVVVTWKDAEGNVSATVPVKGKDYDWQDGDVNWKVHTDGFYYYTQKVAAGGTTENLFTNCQLKTGVTPPKGYNLSVEILAQSIQAVPVTAVQQAWGVTIANGSVTKIGD